MYAIRSYYGIAPGGLNFDSKVRRGSNKPDDLFISYIAGMDTFAKGLLVADKLLTDRVLEDFIKNRYKSYSNGIGKDIVDGKADFESLYNYIILNDQVSLDSGRQEMLEDIVNRYIYSAE